MLLPSSGRSFIYCGSMIIFQLYWLMYYWWFHNNMLIIFLSISPLFSSSFELRDPTYTRAPGVSRNSTLFPDAPAGLSHSARRSRLFSSLFIAAHFVDLRFFLTRRLKKKELERLGCEPSTLDAVRLILRDE